ncbi:uridine kinase [Jatrophihabitans sp. YIM 134969]
MPRFRPVDPEALTDHLLEVVTRAHVAPSDRTVRVLVDGAPATGAHDLADRLVEPLRTLGRAPLRVRAETFWRDASLRLEYGHRDELSLYDGWIDFGALDREVLATLGPDGDGTWLPSLRDPSTNRSTRAARETALPGSVLLLSGSLLLVPDELGNLRVDADVVVHLSASAAALARRTPEADAWTLPVFERYEREARPAARADVVVRVEDPRHPALAVP